MQNPLILEQRIDETPELTSLENFALRTKYYLAISSEAAKEFTDISEAELLAAQTSGKEKIQSKSV